ncbi:hypothetical protein [Micromonospora zhanjiangensis]|uniref:Uncharacterized protein n=1 Tax=Micromonospora zhanjiangensis TaxID=1522057 RepID=A0ABV8KW34_9ACTN
MALLPGLLWFGVNWLACIVATPFAWLGRVAFSRPWPVVAYPLDNKRAEYWGSADGAAAADALAQRVAREIQDRGQPVSLAAPTTSPDFAQDLPQEPVINRIAGTSRSKTRGCD